MMDSSALGDGSSLTTTSSGSTQSGGTQSVGSSSGSGTPLTAANIKTLFSEALRTDLQNYLGILGLTREDLFYEEALKFAKITYDNVVSSLQQGQAAKVTFPGPDELVNLDFVDKFYQALLSNETIVSQDIEEHLAERRGKLSPEALEKYEAEQHQKARFRIAGSWAEVARACVVLSEAYQAAAHPSHDQVLRNASAKREGRDLPGRFAYYLMNVPATGIAAALVGFDNMEGAGKQRGMAQLGWSIVHAFSDAACHNDARQMCDLLSARQVSKEEKIIAEDLDLEMVSKTILAQIGVCPGPLQVLKITNPANHSAVYLINGGKCTRYESIASPDSRNILYNDMIRYDVSASDLSQTVEAVVPSLSQGGNRQLQWEVHQATNFAVLSSRLYKRLRESMTELNLGLALAASNKLTEVDDSSGSAYDLDFARYSTVYVPLEFFNQEREESQEEESLKPISLYNYSDAQCPEALNLTSGRRYRVGAEQQWMSVVYEGPVTNLPKWMNPCGKFVIQDVHSKYQKPQIRPAVATAHESQTTIQQFVFQVVKGDGQLFKELSKPTDANYRKDFGNFVIVEDPFWATGGASRPIIYRENK